MDFPSTLIILFRVFLICYKPNTSLFQQVTNKAGLWSILSSEPFVLDSTPPSGGVVRDGELSTEGDIDFQNYTSSLTCHWEGFHDPHSGIHLYRVGLGTSPNTFDIFQLTSVGLRIGNHRRNLLFYICTYIYVLRCEVVMILVLLILRIQIYSVHRVLSDIRVFLETLRI